ncbi:hypothetical protein TELCIR_13993, partial [Teladorsagia circumcincta]
IHVGGRPPDEFSEGIETSFTGCMARMQLNSVDLLSFAPRDGGHKCQMSKPPSLTLHESSKAFIPFSFLPFSFEFRILPVASVLLDMIDVENNTLLQTTIDDSRKLHLVSNVTRFKQIAHPQINVADGGWHSFSLRIRGPRLEVEIDGYTVLWLEGQEVRRISARLTSLVLSSVGCYRSTTIDFGKVHVEDVSRLDVRTTVFVIRPRSPTIHALVPMDIMGRTAIHEKDTTLSDGWTGLRNTGAFRPHVGSSVYYMGCASTGGGALI